MYLHSFSLIVFLTFLFYVLVHMYRAYCIFYNLTNVCYWLYSSKCKTEKLLPLFLGGYYIYTESSNRHQNESAQIKSPTISPTPGGSCLTFWYSMYGPNIGSLNLYTQTQAILGNPIWTRRGNQGNSWRKAQVTVSVPVQFNVSQVELVLQYF